jgi:hypothetical protein
MRTWVEELVDTDGWVGLSLGEAPTDELPFRATQGVLPADALRRGDPLDVRLEALDTDWVDDFRATDSLTGPSVAADTPGALNVALLDVDPSRTIAPSEYVEQAFAPPRAEQAAGDGDYDYDSIYGRTVARSVQSAAVTAAEREKTHDQVEPPEPNAAPAEAEWSAPASPTPDPTPPNSIIESIPGTPIQLGDHDGLTMTKAQIDALRAAMQAGSAESAAPPRVAAGLATVQAVLCAAQHPNPPQQSVCRVCDLPLTTPPVVVSRPVLAALHFSTGLTVRLDGPTLIGRNPKLEGTLTSEIPRLVKLDVGQGLSRTHASVRLAGWHVLLEDLNSANGTIVTLPGRAPQRLHAGEPIQLELGAHIDFGGEISCVVHAA